MNNSPTATLEAAEATDLRDVAATSTTAAAAAAAAALLSACGGGDDDASAQPASQRARAQALAATPLPSRNEASRFLAQASMGATDFDIDFICDQGWNKWLDEQFGMSSTSRFDWLRANGYGDGDDTSTQVGFNGCMWTKMVHAPDTLRQRIVMALSEILVVGIEGLGKCGGWRAFVGAAYFDLLDQHAFGNYFELLRAISRSSAMGTYLTFRGNERQHDVSMPGGTVTVYPDENYARELLQLFSIGLYQLELNGEVKQPLAETYSQDDIRGLARVFTGWDLSAPGGDEPKQEYQRREMENRRWKYERGEKKFWDVTVNEGETAEAALGKVIEALRGHANVAPFVCKQLIQRLVTSNPSSKYVEDVAKAFNGDGSIEQKGDLRRTIHAILTHTEARNPRSPADTSFGKLREPMLRFVAWARAFSVKSPDDTKKYGRWDIDTSDAALGLGQSPGHSPSVFNFFRPGYTPALFLAFTQRPLIAPEFQITNESSVVGYVNLMQDAISGNFARLVPDYKTALQKASGKTADLLTWLDTLLAAGQLGVVKKKGETTTLKRIENALNKTRFATVNDKLHAALTLILTAPDYLVQK